MATICSQALAHYSNKSSPEASEKQFIIYSIITYDFHYDKILLFCNQAST